MDLVSTLEAGDESDGMDGADEYTTDYNSKMDEDTSAAAPSGPDESVSMADAYQQHPVNDKNKKKKKKKKSLKEELTDSTLSSSSSSSSDLSL